MSLETDTESVLELDREQYVPDWIVEGIVRLALRTGYREPILAAVGGVEGVDVDDDLAGTGAGAGATDGGEGDVIEVEATDEIDGEDASGGRRRGIFALLIVGVAVAVAYRFLSDRS